MKKYVSLLLLCFAFLCCTIVTARTWTAGKFQKEGKLISLTEDGQGVRIQLDSGEIVRVPLSSLSEKDVKYVTEHADPFIVEKEETQNDGKAILAQLQQKFFPGMTPEEIASIKELYWRGKPIQDEDLFVLKGLPQLETLDIRDCDNITNFGLQYIKDLSHLEHLRFGTTRSDCRCNITDIGLENLKELKQLKELRISNCYGITDSGLENLRGLNKLEELNLWSASWITDDGLACLENLVELRFLTLNGCKELTDAGLIHLYGLKNLENLSTDKDKYDPQFSEEALNNLWKEIKAKKAQDESSTSTDEETKEQKEETSEQTSALPAPIEKQDQTKTETNVKNTQSGTGKIRMTLDSFTPPSGFQLNTNEKMEDNGYVRTYRNNNGEIITISDSQLFLVGVISTLEEISKARHNPSANSELKAMSESLMVKEIKKAGEPVGVATLVTKKDGFSYFVILASDDWAGSVSFMVSAKSLQLPALIDKAIDDMIKKMN